MRDITVVAHRWSQGWELHIPDVGVTQSRTMQDAEMMVRDYLDLEGITDVGAITFKRESMPMPQHVQAVEQEEGPGQEERQAPG
jgi:hypothetical protein